MLKLEDLKNSKFELNSSDISKVAGGKQTAEKSMEYYWTDNCSDNSCGQQSQDERAWDDCSVATGNNTSFG